MEEHRHNIYVDESTQTPNNTNGNQLYRSGKKFHWLGSVQFVMARNPLNVEAATIFSLNQMSILNLNISAIFSVSKPEPTNVGTEAKRGMRFPETE